jgi:Fic family protein
LLSLSLSEPLSLPTVLSLSHAIAENKSAYYKAFTETEAKQNYADGTVFVTQIIKLIRAAQEDLLDNLEVKQKLLKETQEHINNLANQNDEARSILYVLAQRSLFSSFFGTSLQDIAKHLSVSAQTARKHIHELEVQGFIDVTKKRPLLFTLSKSAKEQFGIY